MNSPDALLWMVELGAVGLHVRPSRCDRPDRPDFVVFDLDRAGDGTFADVVGAAHAVLDRSRGGTPTRRRGGSRRSSRERSA